MLVAAFWLLATQHCGLEAMGFALDSNHNAAHCASGEDIDACKTVEKVGFKLMGNGVSVPAPDLLVCLLLICAPSIPAAGCDGGSGMPADFIERPRGWVSTWQFVQRAALSPRAPTLSLA
jgi:hypothetical protein